jgi:cation:H+ antiporter
VTALLFSSCAAVIILAGTNLSRYGDVLAARSGLGRTWIGLVLTAGVTSLPELVTGLSSTLVHRAPDVAVGDVAGSCAFNLLLLALVDPLSSPSFSPPKLGRGAWSSLGAGAAGLALAISALLAPAAMPTLGWIGLPSVGLVVLYAVTLRLAFAARHEEEPTLAPASSLSLRKAAGLYAFNAAVVVVAAGGLPGLAVELADASGLGQTFVGGILVGATTSLPEVAVTVSALRIGAAPMAIGSLLGSNLFDLLILALDDAAYAAGPILAAAAPLHLIPLSAALAMTLVTAAAAGTGAWPRPGRRGSWFSATLGLLYVAQLAWLYLASSRGAGSAPGP